MNSIYAKSDQYAHLQCEPQRQSPSLQDDAYFLNWKPPTTKPKYDTTCPTCGGPGYAFTNDGDSTGWCTKCHKTYKSKRTN